MNVATRYTLMVGVLVMGQGLAASAASKPEAMLRAAMAQANKADGGKQNTDAFGDPLPPGVLVRLGSGRLRHGLPVHQLVFTASGKLASAGLDGTVRVWDGESGKELLRLEAGGMLVRGLAVSRDEKLLVVGGDAVYVWEASTGKRLHRLQGTTALNYSVALSPDGTRLASADGDVDVCRFHLWDTASGKMLRTLSTDKTLISQLAFSADGKILAAAHGITVSLWDPATGKKFRELRGHTDTVYGLAFSPDGATLASGSVDKTIRLWNVTTGALIRPLEGHERQVLSVGFSPDGKKLASAGGDNLVRVWEVASGKEVLQIRQGLGERDGNVNCVAFSPDGTTLAAGSNHRRIRLWDAATGKEKQPPRGHDDYVTSLVFTPDGKRLISGCFSGTVIGWDAATGKEVRTYSRECLGVYALALSPDGESLAAGSQMKTYAWKTATGEQILKAPGGFTTRIGFLPQGRLLASDGWSDSKLWDLTTGKSLGEMPAAVLAVTRNGHILHQKGNSLFLHDPTARKDVVEFKLPVPKPPAREDLKDKFLFNLVVVNSAAVSPDGKTLATASQAVLTNKGEGFGAFSLVHEENIHFWEMSTGKLLQKVSLPVVSWTVRDRIGCLAFSPDGRTLAGGNPSIHNQATSQAQVFFWDVGSGKKLHEIQIPRLAGDNVGACLAFSPDGKTLATAGPDTTALIWQLPPAIAARAKKP